jgi:hypothetical protein
MNPSKFMNYKSPKRPLIPTTFASNVKTNVVNNGSYSFLVRYNHNIFSNSVEGWSLNAKCLI